MFLEESSIQNTAFSIWDKMELHEIFRKIREGGRPVPLFVPLLQKTEATSKVVFFMHEIAYWGTDQEVNTFSLILILPIFFVEMLTFAVWESVG